jgi:hypothetical protein
LPRRPFKIDGLSGGVLEKIKPEGGRLRTYAVYGANGGSEPVATLVASEQPDGSWEASFLKPDPSDKTVADRLFDAVEQDLGAALSPNGVLTESAYRRWQAQNPVRVAKHIALDGLWAGLWASPKAAELASAVAAEASRGRTELYSIAGRKKADIEPTWTQEENVDRRKQQPREAVAPADGQQSVYLTASGSLIQFNAIVAAIQGVLLSFNVDAALRAAAAGALSSHVLAAFVLCWAARPIMEPPSTVRGLRFADDHKHAADTFRNYRRGWRMTLMALAASSLAAAIFVLNSFGVTASDLASGWR